MSDVPPERNLNVNGVSENDFFRPSPLVDDDTLALLSRPEIREASTSTPCPPSSGQDGNCSLYDVYEDLPEVQPLPDSAIPAYGTSNHKSKRMEKGERSEPKRDGQQPDTGSRNKGAVVIVGRSEGWVVDKEVGEKSKKKRSPQQHHVNHKKRRCKKEHKMRALQETGLDANNMIEDSGVAYIPMGVPLGMNLGYGHGARLPAAFSPNRLPAVQDWPQIFRPRFMHFSYLPLLIAVQLWYLLLQQLYAPNQPMRLPIIAPNQLVPATEMEVNLATQVGPGLPEEISLSQMAMTNNEVRPPANNVPNQHGEASTFYSEDPIEFDFNLDESNQSDPPN